MDLNGNLISNPNKIGYRVVLGVTIIKIFVRSITGIFGLLFGPLFEHFKSSEMEISMVMNLNLVLSNVAGLFVGFLTKLLSIRIIAFTGGLCVSFGLLMTSFASSLGEVFFTYSVMVGIGVGLVVPSCFLAIVTNFSTGQNQAVGFGMSGGLIGEILLSQIIGLIMVTAGFRKTIFIIGSFAFMGTFGAVLIPTKSSVTSRILSEETKLLDEPKCEEKSIAKKFGFDMLRDKRLVTLISGVSIGCVIAADFGLIFPFFLKVF